MKATLLQTTLLFFSLHGFSQVGINTTTPNAQLEIKSTNQATPANNDGILIPKIDAFPVINPTAAQNSMMVYLTTVSAGKQPGFYFWDNGSTSWKTLGDTASNWTLSGSNLANNNSGNVGIGTGAAVPTSLLTVKKDGIGFTQEDVSGTSKIGFYTVASDAWLQTHSNSDLKFATNNGATQMTLQKGTGNLGINNINPSEKLEVAGKTKTTNLQVTNGAAINNLLVSDAVGNATWQNQNTALNSFAWKTTGNSGTNPSTNFIGTTDDVDLVFKRFNLISGQLKNLTTSFGVSALEVNTGLNNVAFGSQSLKSNTTGTNNAAFGQSSLGSNTIGGSNFAIGYNALGANRTSSNNVAIGANSLSNQNFLNGGVAFDTDNIGIGISALFQNNPTSTLNGIKNLAIGTFALTNNNIGSDNIAFGYNSLLSNESASKNIAIGTQALFTQNFTNAGAVYDADNVAIGYQSLYNTNGTTNANGTGNIGIGKYTLSNNATGNSNIALGNFALGAVGTGTGTMSGNSNLAIGGSALKSLSTGSSNVAFGGSSLGFNTVGNDNISIGLNALFYSVSQSNGIAIGTRAMQNYGISGIAGTNDNVAIGFEALRGTTCCPLYNQNTAVGYQSLTAITTGNSNTALGYQTLFTNTTGQQNTSYGSQSLFKNTTGNYNTAHGYQSLNENSVGNYNSAFGWNALNNSLGSYNTGLGVNAMTNVAAGDFNTVVGTNSLLGNTGSSNNTTLGYATLQNNVSGSGNVAIGNQAGANETGSNKLYIENSNSATPLIFGDFAIDLARINGNLRVNSTTVAGEELQIKNSSLFTHPQDANINFGAGVGATFMTSTQDSSAFAETSGVFGNTNNVTIWSPGNGNRLLRIIDEDLWSDNNGNPYDNGTEKAYIDGSGQYFQVSDKNKKENITKIENASDKINQISGYTYQFKLAPEEIKKGDKPIQSSGVLAQEVEKILPEAVQKNEHGDYFVDYAAITPLLIEAIKEQNTKIKSLEMTNSEILKRLEKLENK
jgi:trimeric autotransporter adhesin